ncbi:RNA polymerase sigma factor [Microbulbifer variabilis]|uniref:RNA polymerase sigma factor n=1 Tax=Microbulbifer variabilis TaxID=266805 RepID=UPI001CFD60E8|nr:RNA polymerase sigma factor [Microbulbifer variabilis]
MYAWPKNLLRRRSSSAHFAELVHPHIRQLYRMAFRWTGSREEAEDLVQDVLASLLARSVALENIQRLGPWLIKVLYHRYVDLYRRRRSSPVDEDVDWETVICSTSEEGVSSQVGMQRALLQALSKLNAGWRDTVLLHDVEGYSLLEVADILDISVGTVKSRLHRAHKKLKKMLVEGTYSESHPC